MAKAMYCFGRKEAVDLDLLLCTRFNKEHADLFLWLAIDWSSMNGRRIDLSNEWH